MDPATLDAALDAFALLAALPLLLGAMFYLFRPLDRVKPLLESPREFCDSDGIRSVLGRYRGRTVKFTASPYIPRFFSMTVYRGKRPCIGDSCSIATPGQCPVRERPAPLRYTLSDVLRSFEGRQKASMQVILGRLGFQWVEVGRRRLVFHADAPIEMFGRRKVMDSMTSALELVRECCSTYAPGAEDREMAQTPIAFSSPEMEGKDAGSICTSKEVS
jgi:hypothetical protein